MELYNETHKVIKAIRKRFNIYHEIPCTADDRRVQEIISIVVQTIEALPSADVVPKSEVEKLQAEAENLRNANADLALALLYECEPTKEHLSELEKAVREKVAREIFEEIEEAIEKCKYNQSTPFGIEERYNPYAIIKQVAKLKKKYTEEKT